PGQQLRRVRARRVARHRERADRAAVRLRQLAVLHERRAGRGPAPALPRHPGGLLGAYLATVAIIIAAVAPLAAAPAFTRAEIPGMAVAERFAGHGFAVAVGIGVAVSV